MELVLCYNPRRINEPPNVQDIVNTDLEVRLKSISPQTDLNTDISDQIELDIPDFRVPQ